MDYQARPDLSPEERLVTIETIVGGMHQRLFGNGQPGEIESMKTRITKLESWFWRAIGALSVLTLILQRVWK